MKAKYLSLHLLGLFFISACGQDTPNVESNSKLESNAIHGTEAMKELSEDATVVVRFEGCQNCIATGALIAKDLVLTARHATSWTSASAIYVQTGLEPSQEKDIKWRVISKTEHPGTDLSLLKLEKPIEGIFPEKLICNIDNVKEGDKLKLVGYGGYGEFSLKPAKGVKYSGYSTYSHEYKYADGDATVNSQGSSAAYTGIGDSGGPMFAYVGGQKKLIGVNVFLRVLMDPTKPYVGTVEGISVARYVDWILTQASAMNSSIIPPCLGEEVPLNQRLPSSPLPLNGSQF